MARGLVGSGGAALLLFLILPARWEGVFVISFLGYALFYVALWSAIGLLLSRRRSSEAASTLDDGSHAHAARGTDGDQPPA